jgi:hypothetical protein
LLGDSADAGQLCLLAAIMISGLLTSSIGPSQQFTVRGEWAFEDLGFKLGRGQ